VLPLDVFSGLWRRQCTGSRFISDLGVTMYCGFGRKPGEDGMETMRDHGRAVATIRA
jgi:hypothetical protein